MQAHLLEIDIFYTYTCSCILSMLPLNETEIEEIQGDSCILEQSVPGHPATNKTADLCCRWSEGLLSLEGSNMFIDIRKWLPKLIDKWVWFNKARWKGTLGLFTPHRFSQSCQADTQSPKPHSLSHPTRKFCESVSKALLKTTSAVLPASTHSVILF